jgi:hypothetical protein
MKISKRTREQAALICAIAALSDERHPIYHTISHDLGLPERAADLAINAWTALRDIGFAWTREMDGEAESLIRSGWSPGDPVVRK